MDELIEKETIEIIDRLETIIIYYKKLERSKMVNDLMDIRTQMVALLDDIKNENNNIIQEQLFN